MLTAIGRVCSKRATTRRGRVFNVNQTLVEFSQQALRALGPTPIPSLNHLLPSGHDLRANPGREPLMEALEAGEVCFSATESKCRMTFGVEPSVLIAHEVRATLESFTLFREGLDSVYRFL